MSGLNLSQSFCSSFLIYLPAVIMQNHYFYNPCQIHNKYENAYGEIQEICKRFSWCYFPFGIKSMKSMKYAYVRNTLVHSNVGSENFPLDIRKKNSCVIAVMVSVPYSSAVKYNQAEIKATSKMIFPPKILSVCISYHHSILSVHLPKSVENHA